MSLYEMDFLKKMVVLLKEAFKFKKYKAMSTGMAILTGILMLPLVVASFFAVAAFSVLGFAFTVLSAPAKYLHDILRGEGHIVKHGTQVIVYLISWPLVFFLYALLSFLLLWILPTYALLSILTYAWSLGGFKFHLFANKVDDISIEVDGFYAPALPGMFIFIGALLTVVFPTISGIDCYIDLYKIYQEKLFFVYFASIYAGYIGGHSAFAFLYSIIGLAPRPKVAALEEAIEIEV